jgi:hypothetical protein
MCVNFVASSSIMLLMFLGFDFFIFILVLDVMLRVLLIVQKLLQENKHSSKRDVYYTHPSVFLGEYIETFNMDLTGNIPLA